MKLENVPRKFLIALIKDYDKCVVNKYNKENIPTIKEYLDKEFIYKALKDLV